MTFIFTLKSALERENHFFAIFVSIAFSKIIRAILNDLNTSKEKF